MHLPSRERSAQARVTLVSQAHLPTRFGRFRILVFREAGGLEHVALVNGGVFGEEDVPTRVHSECLTGDAFGSLRCDCREQLERGLASLGRGERGVLLYLRQEGRGIGLGNKIRAYELQERGMDTVEANLALGLPDDARTYGIAVSMLRTLGVRSIALYTNNPDKVAQLQRDGMRVSRRVPHAFAPSEHNRHYLETKRRRSGHFLDDVLDRPAGSGAIDPRVAIGSDQARDDEDRHASA